MAQDYDWRGIAMLTQQMGQLFEPSKHELLDRQQEHDMNMLMAKQSWNTQIKQIDKLETEYNNLNKTILQEENTLKGMGLNELINASSSDGSLPEAALEVRNNTDIKKLNEMQLIAKDYRDMITTRKTNLANLKSYNEHAIYGEKFKKGTMIENEKDYYTSSNTDGVQGLSFSEQQNMLKTYLKDNFIDEENGIEVSFGSGENVETFKVKPEGIAYQAGFNSTVGTESGRSRDEKSQRLKISTNKEAKLTSQNEALKIKNMTEEQLNNRLTKTYQLMDQIDVKGKTNKGLAEFLERKDGIAYAKDSAYGKGWTGVEVDNYFAQQGESERILKTLVQKGYRVDPNIVEGLSPKIKVEDENTERRIKEDFKVNNHSPQSLYLEILGHKFSKNSKQTTDSMLQLYNDFIKEINEKGYDSKRNKQTIQILLKELK